MIQSLLHSGSTDTTYSSLVDVLRKRAHDTPERLAYQFLVDGQIEGARLTYVELQAGAEAISAQLLASSERGDRALLLYPPGHEFLLAFFGCLQAGIIAIPLSPPDTSRMKRALPRLTAVVGDAQASLVLTTTDIRNSLESHLDERRELRWVNTAEILLNDREPANEDLWQSTMDDIAFLQYTSGSTSVPKGVMVSHGNVLSQCDALMRASGYTHASITATWMPYFHDYGLIEGLLMPLYIGAPCYFMSPVTFIRRPIRWLEAISRYRVTHSQGPNFAYDLCVRKTTPEQRANLELSSWVSAANGAETVYPSTLQAFYETHKECGLKRKCISPAYGLAESTLVVSVTPPDEEPVLFQADAQASEQGKLEAASAGRSFRTIASSGRPLPGTKVEIVNPDTCRRCSRDEVGEIWIASPSVTQGYWKQPEATERTFHARLADAGEGPFLRTGDLGCLRDGQLYITGRLKDLIIIRGLNHYPQDIELTVERSHAALRPGCGAAFSVEVNGEEELVVIHDVQGKQQRNLNANEVLSAIRAAVFEEHELRLHAILLLKPGGVLKTTSGKVQRAAMKAAFAAGELDSVVEWVAVRASHTASEPANGHSIDSARRWLVNWLADKTGMSANEISTSSKFADCGLDSLRATELADALETWLNRRVDATVFWSYSTIDALTEHLFPSSHHTSRDEGDRSQSAAFQNGLARPQDNSPRRFPHAERNGYDTEGIAIVGMGCRFPGGSNSPDEYWELLRAGRDAFSEVPADRWDLASYYDSDPDVPGKMYARHGAFVGNVDQFDPAFFGMTPREAAGLDPQQQLLLEVVWESLEHAGIAPSRLHGSDAGVFVGLSSDDHASWRHNPNGLAEIDAYKVLGTARSIAAGRLAYVLGLHGPVVQLDTACSSSLVAVYQACESLRAGECNLAIAGGVNLMLSPVTMIALCKLTALAPDGRCKTFDAVADGYVRGEGCGIVVLKRMSDAVREGDTILAQIRSAAVNHDGASNGLTAPNGAAQELLIRKSLRKAGIDAREVTYVEAHGTGTELGDPIELNALNRVYGEGRPASEPLYVGSMKTNIGHLEAAAGIAGLLKVVSMLQHGEIAPHLNFKTPNPHVDWGNLPIKVPTERLPWPDYTARGLAAVSSFGFSGTNAHVIVERADTASFNGKPKVSESIENTNNDASGLPSNDSSSKFVADAASVRQQIPVMVYTDAGSIGHDRGNLELLNDEAATSTPTLHLLPLSAKSDESLLALAQKYAAHVAARPEQSIEDICFTAATCRDHFNSRLAVVAASRAELLENLRAYVAGDTTSVVTRRAGENETMTSNDVAFLFTGQGTQYTGMGRELYESQPVFRAAMKRCDELSRNEFDVALLELLYGESPSCCTLEKAAYAQPVLFSLQYALVELWKSWGVRPDVVIGHSLGEYAAACVAGVFDFEVGLTLVATRGRLIDELPRTGVMAVVMADEQRVQAATGLFSGRVSIASVNGPDTTVISGESEAVQAVLAAFTAAGVDTQLLDTSNAGHSALIDPMLESFRTVAARYEYSAPRIDMISNLSGAIAGAEVACDSYWMRHLREPVRFADGMQALAATGCRTFVEIGPNPNLLAMGMGAVQRLRPRPQWLPSLTKDRSNWETMLYSLGEMYVHGADIDWQSFYRPYARSRVSLPTYAFQRQSCTASPLQQPSASVPYREESRLSRPSTVASQIDHLQSGLEDESRILTPQLDEVAVRFIIEAVKQLGFAWHVGEELSEIELHTQIPERHRPKVARVFSRLAERGWVEHADRVYRVKKASPSDTAEALLDALQQAADYPECDLLRRAGPSLAAIWQGDADPLSVLFPEGETDGAVTFYSQAKLLVGYNAMAGEVLREAVAELPESSRLRVLEVGAGTGGLTTHLLPRLPADQCEYVFTDLSPLFLHAARERFREYPFLRTELLNISKPPSDQGFEPASFDLLVAANVLHATPRLHDTLANVRAFLKPDGWLMMLEGANPPLWGDMVFTLIDGWWDFEDKELRPDYPLMRPDRWCRVLEDTGFDDVACLNDTALKDESSNTLYLARSRTPLTGARASHAASGHQSPTGRPSRAEAFSVGSHPNKEEQETNRVTLRDTLVDITDEGELSVLVLNHAARVMRLKPEQIDPTQALAELGLDSLMATELRAQLGKTLERELSLNTLQMRRSVKEIAFYVQQDRLTHDSPSDARAIFPPEFDPNTPRVHLVPLQPKGGQTPLFFVPAGYGDLVAFADIAHAIGTDQPVYGLQPASAKRVKTFRQMSIYRLVSAYLSEIKKVQPTGPYLLSGYSAGGIIAVELARELLRQGDEVGLLVIFDPPSHVPFWLDWFYEVTYRVCRFTGLLALADWMRLRPLRRLFHAFLDEGLRTHTTVAREHRVAPYPGRITHFRANLSQSSLVSLKPMGRFWRKIAKGGTEVHWIPGSHYGMLRGVGQGVVVDELHDCLQRAKPKDRP